MKKAMISILSVICILSSTAKAENVAITTNSSSWGSYLSFTEWKNYFYQGDWSGYLSKTFVFLKERLKDPNLEGTLLVCGGYSYQKGIAGADANACFDFYTRDTYFIGGPSMGFGSDAYGKVTVLYVRAKKGQSIEGAYAGAQLGIGPKLVGLNFSGMSKVNDLVSKTPLANGDLTFVSARMGVESGFITNIRARGFYIYKFNKNSSEAQPNVDTKSLKIDISTASRTLIVSSDNSSSTLVVSEDETSATLNASNDVTSSTLTVSGDTSEKH